MKLIENVNPLVISRITWSEGVRWGEHPYKHVLARKKYGIFSFFFEPDRSLISVYFQPKVTIFGADGSVLKYIECKSNHEAKQLHSSLKRQLLEQLSMLYNHGSDKND